MYESDRDVKVKTEIKTGSEIKMHARKIKSIFMMLVLLLNMVSPIAIFAAQNKENGNNEGIENGLYVIESLVGKGKVLDVCGAEKTDGAKLHIWEKSKKLSDSLNQIFYIDRNQDGSYVIVSLHAEMFLGTKGENKDVKQFNPSFRDNCKWEVNVKGNNICELKLKSNKLSLDVCEGKDQNGTKLQLWESNNTKAQQFRLRNIRLRDTRLVDEMHKNIEMRRKQSELEELLLTGKIDKITKYMVSHFEKLKILNISQEIEDIEEGAFAHCENIEAVSCTPKMLKGFNKSSIKVLAIPEGTKSIEKKDLQGLENLESIEIPKSVEKIEEGTFEKFDHIRYVECDSKWLKYFNKSKIEDLEKLKAEVIKNSDTKEQENIQKQINYFKEKIKVLKNKLLELGVNEKNISNNENLKGIDLLKKLEKETERLLKKYINQCAKKEKELHEQIMENGVKTALKNGQYKTEDLIFGEMGKNESQTTIEEIVKFDAQNKKYEKYAREILNNIEKNDTELKIPKNGLGDISREVGYIFKRIKDAYKIKPYATQVMIVLRLSDEILNGKNTIAEVKTGEGKSFIIAVLALVLSKYGHKVDIVTSTEELARRDNENQRKYYELFGIKSGVLKRKTKSTKNEFNVKILDREIVYSTNSNFEFLCLESVFKKEPERKRKYDVVIVDEVDNMLLDQSSTPAIISERLMIKNREKIFKAIYENRNKTEEEVIEKVKNFFKDKKVPREAVTELHEAAKTSEIFEKNKDYVLKDGEVVIIDFATGYKKPGSRWSNYIHEMLELKEGLKLKESSVSNSMITQKSFFNMYKHITGLTGTVGDEKDKKILEKTYRVKTFKMPRSKASKQKVMYKRRKNDVFKQIKEELEEKENEKVPVLVILPTNAMVEEFSNLYYPEAKKITGVEIEEDRKAISEAGIAGNVTIATNAAGRGIDIVLDEESKKNKGLHVIIPYMPENERILEQAMGRSGRQGQPGSVTIYFEDTDVFYETPEFEENYDKLLEIQDRFAKYVKENHGWLYKFERGNKILFEGEYELGVTPSEILKGSARKLSLMMQLIRLEGNDEAEQILTDTMRHILLKAWGIYFTKVSNNIYEYDYPKEIEEEYDEFIEDLEEYFPKGKRNVSEAISHMMSIEQIKMIDEISGEILKLIGKVMDVLPEPVKVVLENRMVQGLTKTIGGITEIVAGCELCGTIAGNVKGIPMIICGTNMAFEGLQDLWYALRGELDKESKNLIKEFTHHNVDNLVELTEIGMSIYSGKVVAKEIAGEVGKKAGKLSELLEKTKKSFKIKARTKGIVKKFLPKKRCRKIEVVDIENLVKKQGLRPNIQLFANKSMVRVGRWMSREEYNKMIKTGKVQMSCDNKVHVAFPACMGAFEKQAPRGSIYVEFDVSSSNISKGGKNGWGIINGPGSLLDRLNEKRGLPRIKEMPDAVNIAIIGGK